MRELIKESMRRKRENESNLVQFKSHGNSHSGIKDVFLYIEFFFYDYSIQKHIHLTGIIRVCNIFQLLPLNFTKRNNIIIIIQCVVLL